MQPIYNMKNIDLNYLNSYVKYYVEDNSLYLHNTLYNKNVILNGSNETLKELIIVLQQGATYKQLIKILQKISEKSSELYEYLLQNFIVE